MQFEKYEKDGKVAVLVSHGYGAGWSTWEDDGNAEAIAMDRNIVQHVLNKDWDSLEAYMQCIYPKVYLGGMRDLAVHMVKKGEVFEINEYDGNESLNIIHYWIA